MTRIDFAAVSSHRDRGVERLGTACRERGASDVGPGAAFSGRRADRSGNSQGEGGVDLGDSGPDSGALLPEVLMSLLSEFLSLARVIRARHRSSRWVDGCCVASSRLAHLGAEHDEQGEAFGVLGAREVFYRGIPPESLFTS
jgi:hypothetical protein